MSIIIKDEMFTPIVLHVANQSDSVMLLKYHRNLERRARPTDGGRGGQGHKDDQCRDTSSRSHSTSTTPETGRPRWGSRHTTGSVVLLDSHYCRECSSLTMVFISRLTS